MMRPPIYSSPDDPEPAKLASRIYVPTRERHGCLSVWLVLYAITGVIALFSISSMVPQLVRVLPALPVYLMFLVMLGEVICIVATFFWKKWGVYGYLALLTLSMILRLMLGLFTLRSVGSVVFGYAMMYFFALQNIDDYE